MILQDQNLKLDMPTKTIAFERTMSQILDTGPGSFSIKSRK